MAICGSRLQGFFAPNPGDTRSPVARPLAALRAHGFTGRMYSIDPRHGRLAALVVAERCLQLDGYWSAIPILREAQPGPEDSTAKLFWRSIDPKLAHLVTEVLGPAWDLVPGASGAAAGIRWALYDLVACASGIPAGTTEILKNILGERALGLPRG